MYMQLTQYPTRRQISHGHKLAAFVWCLLLIFAGGVLHAQSLSNRELFQKANEHYESGAFEEATEYYHRIIANGVENGPLLYNLGNAYFKQGSIGYALLYYEKAKKYIPRDGELKENIAFARAFLQDKVDEKQQPFLTYILSLLVEHLTLRELAATVSFLLSATLICALVFLYKRSPLWKNASFSLLVLFLLGAALLMMKYRHTRIQRAILISERAEIKSAPSANATTEFIIHEGIDFLIIESIQEWAKISLRDGKTGWTPRATFEQI